MEYTFVGRFAIAAYLLTGKVPKGESFPPEERISDARILSDALNAWAILTIYPHRSDVNAGLQAAAKALGMDEMDPPIPPTGEGFIEYGKKAGLLPASL